MQNIEETERAQRNGSHAIAGAHAHHPALGGQWIVIQLARQLR